MKTLKFVEAVLGKDFIEELAKAELYKPSTNSVVDHEELATALQIVPKTVLRFLQAHLGVMEKNQLLKLQLPWDKAKNAFMEVQKIDNDVYHGEIYREGKILYNFKYRSLPSVGLVLLTTFELYNLDDLKEEKQEPKVDTFINSMIEERLALRNLINQVVDNKINQREALQELLRYKMATEIKREEIKPESAVEAEIKAAKAPVQITQTSKLKEFLEKKKNLEKKENNTFKVYLGKNEKFFCPDCQSNFFKGEKFQPCICYGDDRLKKIIMQKNEDGSVSLKFSKSWDPENIEMLLEVLRRKNGQ
jgi:hypothetical protein